MKNSHRDTIIFTNGNYFSQLIMGSFLERYSTRITAIVLVNGGYKGKIKISDIYNYFRSLPVQFFIFKLFVVYIFKILSLAKNNSIDRYCGNKSIALYRYNDINSKSLYEKIRDHNPNYLVSISCPQKINQDWLKMVNQKAINIHASDLPSYAGLAPYYWVLVNNEKRTCITTHYITDKFDKGNILSKNCMDIKDRHSVFSLFHDLCLLGNESIISAFDKMLNGETGDSQDSRGYSYFSNPTKESYRILRMKGKRLFLLSDIKFFINSKLPF